MRIDMGSEAQGSGIDRLLDIMARLRDPDGGCPWDVEQDFASIAPHTIEEAYEVADVIERQDMAGLVDELGDLLLQVAFHAQMAREAGLFGFDDVVAAICGKLVRRHPHVFDDLKIDDAETQTVAWEELKADERNNAGAGAEEATSALAGVAVALPALTRSLKLQKRAARVGFDWDGPADVVDKLNEEIGELQAEMVPGADPARLTDEVGDLLFTCVNLARALKIDPETVLRHANVKFETRFRRMEGMLAAEGATLEGTSLAEKEARWQRAKAGE